MMSGYNAENMSGGLEAASVDVDHETNATIDNDERGIIQNPYYITEDQNECTKSVIPKLTLGKISPNSTIDMDDTEKIKIVKNLYYE